MQRKQVAAGSAPWPSVAPGVTARVRTVALALLVAPVMAAFAAAPAEDTPGLPADLVVETIDGEELRLEALWQERPLLVTLYYTRCSGVCVPYLLSLGRIANAGAEAERPYTVLALSFDPADGLADVRAQAEALGLAGKPGWRFGVADPEGVRALTAALGFRYGFDRHRKQYDHEAMTAAIIDGRVVRVLRGNPVNARAFRELLWELHGNYVPTYTLPSGAALGRCLDYDPITGETHVGRGLLLLVLPAVLALSVSGLVFRGWGRFNPGDLPGPASRRSA